MTLFQFFAVIGIVAIVFIMAVVAIKLIDRCRCKIESQIPDNAQRKDMNMARVPSPPPPPPPPPPSPPASSPDQVPSDDD